MWPCFTFILFHDNIHTHIYVAHIIDKRPSWNRFYSAQNLLCIKSYHYYLLRKNSIIISLWYESASFVPLNKHINQKSRKWWWWCTDYSQIYSERLKNDRWKYAGAKDIFGCCYLQWFCLRYWEIKSNSMVYVNSFIYYGLRFGCREAWNFTNVYSPKQRVHKYWNADIRILQSFPCFF